MDIEQLKRPLPIDQIDFRIQSINKGGYATILAYKDARADMQRLDEVVGPMNWKREHLNGNHNCRVSIWCGTKGAWVSKEDTGTESNTDAQKGLASDSFKRACTNWGIGRELYSYPEIQVKLNSDEFEIKKGNDGRERGYATWKLRIRDWIWFSQWVGDQLVYLAAKDGSGLRYSYGEYQKEKAA